MSALATNIALFIVYVATSSAGLLIIKRSLSRIDMAGGTFLALTPDALLLAAGVCLYIISFTVWLRILARMPLSTAYPIAIGLTLAFSTTGAAVVLGERLGALKIAGILLIFLGCIALTVEKDWTQP
jgi:multidrug transporter EmrE-like cation transporter